MKTTIKLGNKEYKFKNTLRALMLFESTTGKAFKIETLTDSYLYYYCILLANNPDNVLDWDEYINYLDEDPDIITEFSSVLESQNKKDKLLEGKDSGNNSESKKKA